MNDRNQEQELFFASFFNEERQTERQREATRVSEHEKPLSVVPLKIMFCSNKPITPLKSLAESCAAFLQPSLFPRTWL